MAMSTSTGANTDTGGAVSVPSWRLPALVVVVGLAVRGAVRLAAGDQLTDDAYIFFRYANNAADGHGVVYNVGEHVYGFTSPLYTLVLTPVAAVAGRSHLPTAAVVLGLATFAGFAWIATRLAQHSMVMPVLAGVVVAAYFSLVLGSLNGMETSLFLLLVFGSTALLVHDRLGAGVLLAALCLLTRPEGALFAVLVGAAIIVFRRKDIPWRAVIAAAVLVTAWVLYARVTYGTFLPQSLLAKAGATESAAAGVGGPVRVLATLAFGLSTSQFKQLGAGRVVLELAAVGLLAVVLLDAVQLARRRSLEVVLPLFFVAVWLGYSVAKPVNIWSWYTAPTSALFLWSVVRQAGALATRVRALGPSPARRERWAAAVAVVVLLGGLVVATGRRTDNLRAVVDNLDAAGAAVQTHDPRARSVMLGDIGIVGYRLDPVRIVDLSGLVTTEPAEHSSGGELVALGRLLQHDQPSALILADDPLTRDRIVTGSLARPTFDNASQRAWFTRHYQVVQRPARGQPAGRGRWVWLWRGG